jgi:hypothetical protein
VGSALSALRGAVLIISHPARALRCHPHWGVFIKRALVNAGAAISRIGTINLADRGREVNSIGSSRGHALAHRPRMLLFLPRKGEVA